MHSDQLKLVTWLATSSYSALLHSGAVTKHLIFLVSGTGEPRRAQFQAILMQEDRHRLNNIYRILPIIPGTPKNDIFGKIRCLQPTSNFYFFCHAIVSTINQRIDRRNRIIVSRESEQKFDQKTFNFTHFIIS